MNKVQTKNNYAFIDGQNLYLGKRCAVYLVDYLIKSKKNDKWYTGYTKNTEEKNSSVSFVRRQVELNHIPFDGTIQVSVDGQNHLTSTSPNLRNVNYTNDTKENNISNNENAVFGSVNGNVTSTDTRYNQYTQWQNFVNTSTSILVWISMKAKASLFYREASWCISYPTDFRISPVGLTRRLPNFLQSSVSIKIY